MSKNLIIANWKMNPASFVEAKRLFEAVEKSAEETKNIEAVVAAPFVWLFALIEKNTSNVKIAAQDCFWEQKGAFTGEVSAAMLKNIGCEYVIVGHSERRQYFRETDEIANLKLKAALAAGLKPVLCIGEKMEEKDQVKDVLEKQLKEALRGVETKDLRKVVIAYEPVWAISTSGGQFCSADYAFSASLLIRKFLMAQYGKSVGDGVRIIYGGSVDAGKKSAVMYIREAKMDGVLVGAASLNAAEFGKIMKSVDEIKV